MPEAEKITNRLEGCIACAVDVWDAEVIQQRSQSLVSLLPLPPQLWIVVGDRLGVPVEVAPRSLIGRSGVPKNHGLLVSSQAVTDHFQEANVFTHFAVPFGLC